MISRSISLNCTKHIIYIIKYNYTSKCSMQQLPYICYLWNSGFGILMHKQCYAIQIANSLFTFIVLHCIYICPLSSPIYSYTYISVLELCYRTKNQFYYRTGFEGHIFSENNNTQLQKKNTQYASTIVHTKTAQGVIISVTFVSFTCLSVDFNRTINILGYHWL